MTTVAAKQACFSLTRATAGVAVSETTRSRSCRVPTSSCRGTSKPSDQPRRKKSGNAGSAVVAASVKPAVVQGGVFSSSSSSSSSSCVTSEEHLGVETAGVRHIATDVSELVGKTPLIYLNKVVEGCKATIAVKVEAMQPCSSVKDRVGFAMIEDAESKGLIQPGKTTLVEPTSGNMGIALAFAAAAKGYKLICTMPSYASLERRVLMLALGAQLVITAPEKSVGGAVDMAEEIVARDPNAFMLQQFTNPANVQVHFETTGPEIWEDTAGEVDVFVAGIGSGGTVTGVGHYLKSKNPHIKIFGLEPAESNVLNGGKQGTGTGFKPEILDLDVMEAVLMVESDAAVAMARKLAVQEGLLAGISSGANVEAAIRLAKRPEFEGNLIVTLLPSTGERYLSGPLFEEARKIATDMQVSN